MALNNNSNNKQDDLQSIAKQSTAISNALTQQSQAINSLKQALHSQEQLQNSGNRDVNKVLQSSLKQINIINTTLGRINTSVTSLNSVVSNLTMNSSTSISLLSSIKTNLIQITSVLTAFRADFIMAANGQKVNGNSYYDRNLLTKDLKHLQNLKSNELRKFLNDMVKASNYANISANSVKGRVGNSNILTDGDGDGKIDQLLGKLDGVKGLGGLLALLGGSNGSRRAKISGMGSKIANMDTSNIGSILDSLMSDKGRNKILDPLKTLGRDLQDKDDPFSRFLGGLLAKNGLTKDKKQREKDPNLVFSALAPFADDIKDMVEYKYNGFKNRPKIIPDYATPVWIVNQKDQKNYIGKNEKTQKDDLEKKRLMEILEGVANNTKDKYGNDLLKVSKSEGGQYVFNGKLAGSDPKRQKYLSILQKHADKRNFKRNHEIETYYDEDTKRYVTEDSEFNKAVSEFLKSNKGSGLLNAIPNYQQGPVGMIAGGLQGIMNQDSDTRGYLSGLGGLIKKGFKGHAGGKKGKYIKDDQTPMLINEGTTIKTKAATDKTSSMRDLVDSQLSIVSLSAGTARTLSQLTYYVAQQITNEKPPKNIPKFDSIFRPVATYITKSKSKEANNILNETINSTDLSKLIKSKKSKDQTMSEYFGWDEEEAKKGPLAKMWDLIKNTKLGKTLRLMQKKAKRKVKNITRRVKRKIKNNKIVKSVTSVKDKLKDKLGIKDSKRKAETEAAKKAAEAKVKGAEKEAKTKVEETMKREAKRTAAAEKEIAKDVMHKEAEREKESASNELIRKKKNASSKAIRKLKTVKTKAILAKETIASKIKVARTAAAAKIRNTLKLVGTKIAGLFKMTGSITEAGINASIPSIKPILAIAGIAALSAAGVIAYNKIKKSYEKGEGGDEGKTTKVNVSGTNSNSSSSDSSFDKELKNSSNEAKVAQDTSRSLKNDNNKATKSITNSLSNTSKYMKQLNEKHTKKEQNKIKKETGVDVSKGLSSVMKTLSNSTLISKTNGSTNMPKDTGVKGNNQQLTTTKSNQAKITTTNGVVNKTNTIEKKVENANKLLLMGANSLLFASDNTIKQFKNLESSPYFRMLKNDPQTASQVVFNTAASTIRKIDGSKDPLATVVNRLVQTTVKAATASKLTDDLSDSDSYSESMTVAERQNLSRKGKRSLIDSFTGAFEKQNKKSSNKSNTKNKTNNGTSGNSSSNEKKNGTDKTLDKHTTTKSYTPGKKYGKGKNDEDKNNEDNSNTNLTPTPNMTTSQMVELQRRKMATIKLQAANGGVSTTSTGNSVVPTSGGAIADGTVAQYYLNSISGGRINSHMWRDDGDFHGGTDFGSSDEPDGSLGQPIYTPIDIVVDDAEYSPNNGNYVCGIDAKGHYWYWMHMLELPLVNKGDTVKAGTLLGYIGDTGKSNGSHLHVTIADAREYHQECYDPETFDIKTLSGPKVHPGDPNPYKGSNAEMGMGRRSGRARRSYYGLGDHIYQRDYSNISFNKSGDSELQTLGDSGCAPAAAATIKKIYSSGIKSKLKKYGKGRYGRGNYESILAAMNGDSAPEKFWKIALANGLSKEYTAGIMGNIQRESGFDWSIIEGGDHSTEVPHYSGGYGLIQWTGDEFQTACDNLVKKLTNNKYGLNSFEGQVLLIILTAVGSDDLANCGDGMNSYNVNLINGAGGLSYANTLSVEDATRFWEEYVERAGVVAMEDRIAFAKEFYDKFSKGNFDINGLSFDTTSSGATASSSATPSSSSVGSTGWISLITDQAITGDMMGWGSVTNTAEHNEEEKKNQTRKEKSSDSKKGKGRWGRGSRAGTFAGVHYVSSSEQDKTTNSNVSPANTNTTISSISNKMTVEQKDSKGKVKKSVTNVYTSDNKTTLSTNGASTIVICNNFAEKTKLKLDDLLNNFKHLNGTQSNALKVLKAISDLLKEDTPLGNDVRLSLDSSGLEYLLKGL